MGSELKKRVMIFAGVLAVALVFLYPTLNIILKKVSGEQITSEEMLKGGLFSKPISLGLDLSGGVHLVYRVKASEAVAGRVQGYVSRLRSEFRAEKIAVTKVKVNDEGQLAISLFSARSLEKAKSIVEDVDANLILQETGGTDSRPVLVYGINAEQAKKWEKTAIIQAVETLRNRVDQFGVAEPVIQRQGEDRIVLQMPGVKDVDAVKKVVGKVAKLEFRLLPPPGSTKNTVTLKNKDDGTPIKVGDEILLTGAAVDDARVSFDQTQQIEVSLTLTKEGGRTFGQITGQNVGRNLAIVLDGEVYSAPVIRERIGGGRCSISGGFSLEEARQLAVVLRAGALPAPLEVMEERTVGPTLGAESIRKGIIAIMIGFGLVMVFMVAYYKKSGVVAVGVLGLNVVLILAGLSAFGATLTLPGLAGLALTVGMAVDANVIVFERIREELRNGATRDAAVSSGFGKALSAIIDANITTLLAGLILYYFGTGPIRGFAVTLSIGILTTIYCATFVARLAFDYFPLKGKAELSI